MAEPRVTETGVPIDHLDYTYVRNCKNIKEVEKILRVLRSRSEGYYPDLIRFTEDRLYELCPQSKLLIKTSEARRTSDLPFEESRQLNADLEQWTSEMNSEKVRHENGPTSKGCGLGGASGRGGGMFDDEEEESEDSTLPPIRTPGSITKTDAGASQNVSTGKSERIPSHDFRAWDKYNADREAENVDNGSKKTLSSSVGVSPKGIPTELSETERSMSSIEKEKAALREKNKGNEAYRAGDHQEALVYYTRSINFFPSAAAYNNRAITGIKLGRNEKAISDCVEVLKLEPDNTKALFRRATAYSNVKEYRAAAEDLEHALQLEPNNKKVQEELNRLRKNHLETVEQQEQPKKKGTRIQIEESDGEEEEESSEGEKESTTVELEQETGGGQATDGQQQREKEGEEGETEGEKVTSDGQEVPSSTSTSSQEAAKSDGAVGYSIPNPRSENPETASATANIDVSPPLDDAQLQSSPTEEQKEAPPTEVAKEVIPQSESVAQATLPQQDEAPPQAEAPETAVQARQETPPPKIQEAPPPEPPPELPPSVKKLKEEGNDLFRRGQYGEAVNRYSKGIKLLEKESKAHVPNISTLLNNRSACHLKNGNIRGCIDDCTQSLELVPVNLKALLRRAQAYEAMERYKQAYNDFHLALRIDNSVEAAYTACTRITRLLQSSEGHNWRSKLPPHPDAERVKAALAEHKYRSGSLAGVPSLSAVINVDQSSVSGISGISNGGSTDISGSSSNHRDGPPAEASVGATATATAAAATVGGTSSAESTDDGKRERRKEERKEQADERVPEIPPVNVTAASNSTPQVTQATQSVPSPHHAEAPPTGPSLSQLAPEQKFERLKAEGNEHVKKGEFVEALNCYSLCINACPNRVVAYTNRALCHLKLKSPRSAEEDCSMALTFEPNNVKALYRRALARKALCKYMEATKDLKTLLEVDQGNSVAQQEFEEVKQLWTKKLREIQLQKETAKAAPGAHKTKAGKVGGTSRKKSSGQRKSSMKEMKESMKNNPIAELQKTKNELERLLKETTKLQEAARLDPKKPANPTPSQMRKSELDKLIKESKAKTKANSEAKASSDGKAPQAAKAGETRATRGAGSRGAKGRARGGSSDQSQAATTTTPSGPTEIQMGQEKMSGIFTKEKSDTEGHLTASKTTYYKEEKSKKEERGVATPPTTEIKGEARQPSSSSSLGKEKDELAGESKRKKVVIEEGSESDEEEEEEKGVESEAAPATTTANKVTADSSSVRQQTVTSQDVQEKPPAAATATASPSAKAKERLASPYEFVQRWNAIPRTAQSIEYARLLEQITPETLPEVITNKLDGMMLTNIIRAIDKQFVPKRQYKLSVDILLYLTKVPRFEMNAMFLGPIEKEDLKSIFTVLSEHKDEVSVPPAMLETMKRSYGVQS